MAIVLGIIFSVVVVLYPLIGHLIQAVLLCFSGLFTNIAQDAPLNESIAEKTFGRKGFLAIGWPLKSFLVVVSLILLWWAMKFNSVCCTTLLVLGAALVTGRVLALFGCGVLSMLQCFMRSAVANITWSEHLQPICDPILHVLLEVVADYATVVPLGSWDK